MTAGKTTDAVALYNSAAKAAPNKILGDFARLRAAQALLDTTPYPQLETRLTPLIGQNKPFDLDARKCWRWPSCWPVRQPPRKTITRRCR